MSPIISKILISMVRKILHTLSYWLTWPLKKLFALIGKKRVEEFTLKPMSLPAKVISVGNITLGGTGKTPTVMWLVKKIKKLHPHLKVGIHLRGYRGEMENRGGVVSDGKKIYAGPREAGDEAFLLARELLELNIPVGVGKHKVVTGKAMIKRFNLEVIIFDDAYQFTSLTRDMNILLIDALRPFGEAGFPREGVMREPLDSLDRADILILTRTELVGGGALRGIIDRIKPYLKPGTHIFLSSFIPQKIIAIKSGIEADLELISQRRALPLSAIGNPRGFELMLEKLGLRLLKPMRYPDHHRFTPRDISNINKRLIERGGHLIITTEKDAVRLGRLLNDIQAPIYSVPVEFEIAKEGEFLKLLNEVLCSTITVKQSGKELTTTADGRVLNVKDDLERIASEEDALSRETSTANVGEGSDEKPGGWR